MIRLLAGTLVFFAVSALSGLWLALLWGSLTPDIAWLALGAGAVSGTAVLLFLREKEEGPSRLSRLDAGLLFLFSFFCLKFFSRMMSYQDGVWKTLSAAEITLPVYFARIAYLARGVTFWPENPLLIVEPFHNFGMELLTALLVQQGASALPLLFLMAVTAMLLTAGSLMLWGRGAALGVFLFWGGGAGWILWVSRMVPEIHQGLTQEVVRHGILPFGLLVSEPAFYFVFPAGILLLHAWREKLLRGRPFLPEKIEGLLWGAIALFHLQSFIFLSFIFCLWCFSETARKNFRNHLAGLGLPVLLAAPVFFFSSDFFRDFSAWLVISPRLGGSGDSLWSYFLKTSGYSCAWMLMALLIACRKKNLRKTLWMTAPALAVSLLLVLIDTSAWKGQGVSLQAWCYILFSGAAAVFLTVCQPSFRAVLLLFLFLPGFWIQTSSLGFLNRKVEISHFPGPEALCRELAHIPPGSRIATVLEPHHPVAFCGYPVVSVFNDSLFASGSRQRQVSERVRHLMAGRPDWREIADSLNVRYLFWGSIEQRHFQDSPKPWEDVAPVWAEGPWGRLYDLGDRKLFSAAAEAGQGLEAWVFGNRDWSGEPLMRRQVTSVDYLWDDAHREVLRVPFSILFQGEVFVPESGEITFYLASDDGSALYLGEERVVDNLGEHPIRIQPGKRFLERGWHPLKIRYYEVGGVGMIRLWWKLPSGKEQQVPARYLRPGRGEGEG